MEKTIIMKHGVKVAIISSDTPVINNTADALDLLASLMYNDECQNAAIGKSAITEDFFDLRTGIAGEILQKFETYACRIAIVGDFSHYESKALRDFIYECNSGNSVFFAPDVQEAVKRLS